MTFKVGDIVNLILDTNSKRFVVEKVYGEKTDIISYKLSKVAGFWPELLLKHAGKKIMGGKQKKRIKKLIKRI